MGDNGGTRPLPEGPIFVAGASRSGKTLVRWLLSSHRRIVVTRRTEMWTRFADRFGDLTDDDSLEGCLAAMLRRRHVALLEPDLPRLRRDFRSGPPTYGRLFALVHEQYAERVGKPRWGDQTGGVERFADRILTELPEARVLHLLRDPRDRFVGLLERGPRRPGAVGRSTAEWLSSASLAERNRRRHPDRYEVLRYEDLVTAPGETVRGVCAFLGEAFEPEMLRMDGVRRYDAVRAASEAGSPISTAYVGRYRDRLTPADIAFIQSLAGGRMRAFGYPPDPIRLRPVERVRYLARWPVSRVRMRRPA